MWHKWQNPTFTKDVQKSRFSLKKKTTQKPLKKTNKKTNKPKKTKKTKLLG